MNEYFEEIKAKVDKIIETKKFNQKSIIIIERLIQKNLKIAEDKFSNDTYYHRVNRAKVIGLMCIVAREVKGTAWVFWAKSHFGENLRTLYEYIAISQSLIESKKYMMLGVRKFYQFTRIEEHLPRFKTFEKMFSYIGAGNEYSLFQRLSVKELTYYVTAIKNKLYVEKIEDENDICYGFTNEDILILTEQFGLFTESKDLCEFLKSGNKTQIVNFISQGKYKFHNRQRETQTAPNRSYSKTLRDIHINNEIKRFNNLLNSVMDDQKVIKNLDISAVVQLKNTLAKIMRKRKYTSSKK